MLFKVLALVTKEFITRFSEAYAELEGGRHKDESVIGFNSAIAPVPAFDGTDADMPYLPGMLRPDYKGPMIGFVRSCDDILITAEGDDQTL